MPEPLSLKTGLGMKWPFCRTSWPRCARRTCTSSRCRRLGSAQQISCRVRADPRLPPRGGASRWECPADPSAGASRSGCPERCRWERQGSSPPSPESCKRGCRLLRSVRCSSPLRSCRRCRRSPLQPSCSGRRRRGRTPAQDRRRPCRPGRCWPDDSVHAGPGHGGSARRAGRCVAPESSRSCSGFCAGRRGPPRPCWRPAPWPCQRPGCLSSRGWMSRQKPGPP